MGLISKMDKGTAGVLQNERQWHSIKKQVGDDPFSKPFALRMKVDPQLSFCLSISSKYVRALGHEKDSDFFFLSSH